MSEVNDFAESLMRALLRLHNGDGINVMTNSDLVWALVKAVGEAGDLIERVERPVPPTFPGQSPTAEG